MMTRTECMDQIGARVIFTCVTGMKYRGVITSVEPTPARVASVLVLLDGYAVPQHCNPWRLELQS